MSARYRPRRPRLPSCGTVALFLTVVAAAAWVVVRAVTAWITGHPGAVAGIVALAAMGGAGASRVSGRTATRQVARASAAREFAGLTPTEFEEALAGLCWRDDCRDVQVVGGAGDLAADVLATTPDGQRILIQAKKYAPGRRVGSQDVQRVGGTYAVVHQADMAIVVTTTDYTSAAHEYARQAGIRLVDGGQLAAWASGGRPPWN